MNQSDPPFGDDSRVYVRRHTLFGWWSLAAFLSLGIILEGLWALRAGAYVDELYSIRRLVWRLAHAHGTLFGMIHILYGVSMQMIPRALRRGRRLASPCLMAASILMPGGFLLGGMFLYGQGGDPGWGIFLVPVGAGCLAVSVVATAFALTCYSWDE